MAIIDKKQTRWYAKSTFDSLDKTTIPVGTEIQVTGEIEEADLTADLQTKINNKLTAPTTPTSNSVVTMLADGTTGTKALSEFGGKLYKHETSFNTSNGQYYSFSIITGELAAYTLDTLESNLSGAIYYGTAGEYGGVIRNYDASTHILYVNGGSAEFTLTSITDIVREL